jgi:hypothetical protein
MEIIVFTAMCDPVMIWIWLIDKVCRWNDNGKCRKYGTGCRFPRGGHPKTK